MTQTPKDNRRKVTPESPPQTPGGDLTQDGSRYEDLRVMVVNEPRSYREALTAAFKALRPEMEVFTVDPEYIDEEFLRRLPHLVLCSHLTELISREALAWIELYPDGASHALANLDGETTRYQNADLETLLSVLDESHYLAAIP